MSEFLLAVDQGTTGTTSTIINRQGDLIASANVEFSQIYPRPGWVEHDPEEIWKSVLQSISQVLEKSHLKGSDVAALGITNQRESIVVWDRKTHQPLYNVIVWQCRRTESHCARLKRQRREPLIRQKTGLVIDPYFSATKLRWILQEVEACKKRRDDLAFGTMDTFLIWRLTGGKVHRTDVSNASRTLLMNIKTGQWDPELLKLFGISANILPEIVPSSGLFGHVEGIAGLPDGLPITGVAGDQQAALFGQGCFEVGESKCTFGTGSFILMNTGSKMVRSKSGLLTTVAWQLGKEKMVYALEGGAFICGAAVQWLRDGLHMIEKSSDIEALANAVSDTEGVDLVPAMTGLGAPYWDANARGLICGITRGTRREHIARATLESMALQNGDILRAMQKDLGRTIRTLRVDGGASANNLLLQMQSDYLGAVVERPEVIESTSRGAAFLAGLGVGFWSHLQEIKKVNKMDATFKSKITAADRKRRIQRWHDAICRAQGLKVSP